MNYFQKKQGLSLGIILLLVVSVSFFGCASPDSIFPAVVVSTDESVLELPNPIDIVVDEANGQILVASSNVDIFYITGSLSVLQVDGSDADAPVLTASTVIEAPNFAGKMYADGAGSVFIPFRETSATDANQDILAEYTLADDSVGLLAETEVAEDPFGITGDGASTLYVVSDNVLSLFDTNLNRLAEIDLTVAEAAGFSGADASSADYPVYDATGNRLIVSNRTGSLFVVDLSTNTVDQIIEGPESTRDLLINGSILYALDAGTRSVWVFDLDLLSNSAELVEVDDSTFVVTTIPVGTDPNGMILDAVDNRLYVANSFDDTISVIDLNTQTEINRVSIDAEDIATSFLRDGEDPQALALGTFNGNKFLFVASFGTNSVVVINTASLEVVAVFPNTNFALSDDVDQD